MGIAVKKWFICYKVPFIYYVGTCRVGGSRVGQLFDISSTKTSQLVTVRRDEVVWEEALCAEMGFYVDISWESRSNIEINV